MKKAWLHKNNDNYYTDEQFKKELAHQPWIVDSYIPFVEECPVIEASKEVIEKHAETFLKLRIAELEEQLKALQPNEE